MCVVITYDFDKLGHNCFMELMRLFKKRCIDISILGGMTIHHKNICLKEREDILLRAYVLSSGNSQIWKEFCEGNAKIRRHEKDFYKIEKSIEEEGQHTPIRCYVKKGKIYPLEGSKR